MYVVYHNFHTGYPPPRLLLWPVLSVVIPARWTPPDGEDLAAGESWSKYPRFMLSLTTVTVGQLRSVTLMPAIPQLISAYA